MHFVKEGVRTGKRVRKSGKNNWHFLLGIDRKQQNQQRVHKILKVNGVDKQETVAYDKKNAEKEKISGAENERKERRRIQ